MLKTGKLDSDLLEKIVFNNIKFRRPEVLTRPGIGEDCAVVDFGSYVMILLPTGFSLLELCWLSCFRKVRRKRKLKK